MKLTNEQEILIRNYIRDNWDFLVSEISLEAQVPPENVENVLDSLRCYLLFNSEDPDQSCIRGEKHIKEDPEFARQIKEVKEEFEEFVEREDGK